MSSFGQVVLAAGVVLLKDQSLERQQAWDAACTASGTAFYSAASWAACTYLFTNLYQHTFTPLALAAASAHRPALQGREAQRGSSCLLVFHFCAAALCCHRRTTVCV